MTKNISLQLVAIALAGAVFTGCSGGSLTTREKGAGIGAVGGAAAGGLIGATVGHPGAGAAIGGALGLGESFRAWFPADCELTLPTTTGTISGSP